MKTVAVLSPRILLSIQNLKSLIEDLTAHKQSFRVINLNSGEFDQQTLNQLFCGAGLNPTRIRNTTSPQDLRNWYHEAQDANVDLLLIGSTYHSAPRLREAGIIPDLVLNDEAHYLVGEQFDDCFGLGEYQYSFTATQKVTDSLTGRGMDNEALFGPVVYTKSPKRLIDAGEMVAPAIHIVDADGVTDVADDDYEAIARCVTSAFLAHEKVVRERSISPVDIGAKLLVTCDGEQTFQAIWQTEAIQGLQSVKLFGLSSESGTIIAGQHKQTKSPRGRQKFLEMLQMLKPDERAIIVHIDTLAEGLDVPGITGIMPFRNLGPSKFLQTLGRATRLHNKDRTKLYAETLQPGDYESYTKPFAWVVIPRSMTNGRDAYGRYLRYVEDIRNNYDMLVKDLVIVDDDNGFKKPEGPEFVNTPDDKNIGISKSMIESFLHNFEDTERIALEGGQFWHDEMWWSQLEPLLAGIPD